MIRLGVVKIMNDQIEYLQSAKCIHIKKKMRNKNLLSASNSRPRNPKTLIKVYHTVSISHASNQCHMNAIRHLIRKADFSRNMTEILKEKKTYFLNYKIAAISHSECLIFVIFIHVEATQDITDSGLINNFVKPFIESRKAS